MERPWLRYYDPNVPPTLDYPNETLAEMFERVASTYADTVATIFHNAKLPYGVLHEEVERLAAGLQSRGIEAGERVAIMLPNIPQFPIAFFATLRAGAVAVPTNPLYTERELAHQLSDSGSVAIFTLPQLLPTVLAVCERTDVRMVIVAEIADALPWYLRSLFRLKERRQGVRIPRRTGVFRWRELLATARMNGAGVVQRAVVTPDSIAVLQYTGGTTGTAKGAMLTHRNLLTNAHQAFIWQAAHTEGQVATLCVAPFFHVYGLTIGMLLTVLMHGTMLLIPRFRPQEVRAVARRYRPQLFPGVPTMFVALSSLPDLKPDDFSSLRVCISGAAPLPPEVQTRFSTLAGTHLIEGYGLTEASPVTHANPLGSPRAGSIGVPMPDTDAAIVGSNSWEKLSVGEIGELIVRGPQVMAGYWKRPDETVQVLRDGWLRTGDLAHCDADGYFYIVDRLKDMIIAGGYNIYPREVEDVLYSHPAVQEAAVIGVPDEYRGETVKAFIVLKPGQRATAEDIIAYCRTQLAAYKVPKRVEFVDDLPKSLVGKVLRRELREQATSRSEPQIPTPGSTDR
jgi:long-chain acyl-CoA synthetase